MPSLPAASGLSPHGFTRRARIAWLGAALALYAGAPALREAEPASDVPLAHGPATAEAGCDGCPSPGPRDKALASSGDVDDFIAFCRPWVDAGAGEPCLCSAEQMETAVTSGQFVRHMQERRAAGATSAAELRTAMHRAREACGEGAAASPATPGALPGGPGLPPARRQGKPWPGTGGSAS